MVAEEKSNSFYEIIGGIINAISLFFSLISIASSRNKVLRVTVIFLIIIMVSLYYLLREHFHIYNNNNEIANQIYFYSSIVLFISAFVLLLKS